MELNAEKETAKQECGDGAPVVRSPRAGGHPRQRRDPQADNLPGTMPYIRPSVQRDFQC